MDNKTELSRADLFALHTVEWIKKKKESGGLRINGGLVFHNHEINRLDY